MSVPCSDQSHRPKKMKDASLPRGVRAERCWCGNFAKVKEVEDFSDKLGMKFFMCANYDHDPPPNASLTYPRPPSPPPLCMWYHWIDTEQPAWALREIEERSRRAWESFYAEEHAQEAAARAKAEREREMREYREEQRAFFREMGRKNEEDRLRMQEEERVREELREAERQRKRERAAEAKAAEERGDKKGKYPRWTQDH